MANCISLDDALKLVYHRGKLMGSMPVGSMLLVKASKKEAEALLIDGVTICVHNTHDNFVIGGTKEKILQQVLVLEANQITYRKLKVSHAYHTSMMENVLAAYKKVLSEVEFKPLEGTKIFSTFTGDIVESELFCSPQYWLDQIIHPVKFCDAIENTMRYFSNPVFIEAGPGSGLSSFVKSIATEQANMVVLLPKPSKDKRNNLKQAIAKLYAKGVLFQLPKNQAGKRISLPGYSFAKNYFWKPKLNIGYVDFESIKTSYHNTNTNYQSNRLKTSIEIKTQKSDEISKETLEELHKIQEQYTNEIKKLFSSEKEEIVSVIEVMYDEVRIAEEENASIQNEGNTERNTSSVFVAPATENEKIIATYWEDILGYNPAGVLDNYFEVGGNSLLATQLINKIIQKTGVEISIAEVLTYDTIKDLALLVDEKQWLRDEKEFSNEIVL
jgi:acyl transferase domain-containing protein